MKRLKVVIANIKPENIKDVNEALCDLVRKGKVNMRDIYVREEEV